MRLETISLKGVLAFRDPVTVDFREMPSGLIAIIGKNGDGKTCLIESCIAPIGRTFPSRSERSLVDYALDQDSFIETTYSMNGRGTFRARIGLDGQRRQSDAILEQTVGGTTTLLNDGKLTTFDQAVAREFPPRDLLLASAFASQNRSGSFVTLDRKGRRALFSTLLGLDHYDAISQTANAAAKLLTDARVQLAAVREALSRDLPSTVLTDLSHEAAALERHGETAAGRQQELERTIADLEDQVALCGDVSAAYASASLRLRDLDRQLADRRREQTATETGLARIERDLATHVETLMRSGDVEVQSTDALIANNRWLAGRAQEIRDAVTQLGVLMTQIDVARSEHQANQAVVVSQQGTLAALEGRLAVIDQVRADLQRTTSEAKQLKTVPCQGAGEFAACRFIVNAAAAAQRIPDLERAVEPRAAIVDERTVLSQDITALRTDNAVRLDTVARLQAEERTIRKVAALADTLAASEARIEELQRQRAYVLTSTESQMADAHERAGAERQRLQATQRELSAVIAALLTAQERAQSDLRDQASGNDRANELRRYLSDARASFNETQRTLGTVQAQAEAIVRRRAEVLAKMAQRSELSGRIAELDAELLEFQLIARMCGRDGLPTLEIDAAGPTVSAYANDILSVVMPRFTVELVTQEARLSKGKDGSTHKEVFDLKVLDNEQGGERVVSDLSGGQQVIVDEALKSALSIHANSRNISPIETCWRDETTGALHPDTAPLYVQMLRRAHELGKFFQTLYVTHSPEAAAQADAQLYVHDGQVDVIYPPYAA